jgi:hypothetical protein
LTDGDRPRRPRTERPGCLARFVASLLLATATVLVLLTAALWSLVSVVLGPAHWLGALDASGAYERAPAAIAEQLAAGKGPGGSAGLLGPLEPADVEALVSAAAPPEWLREQTHVVLPPLIESLAATGELRGTIRLESLKLRLSGASFQAALLAQIGSWPDCSADQLRQVSGGTLVRCRPPADLTDELSLAIAAILPVVTAQLPDEIDLAAVVPGATGATAGPAAPGGVIGPLRAVAVARPIVTSLALVGVLVLAAATLVSGLTIRSTLRVWAIPLAVGGLGLLLLGWIVDPVLAAAADGARVSASGAGAAPRLVEIGVSLAAEMVLQVRLQAVLAGMALITGGILLLSVRWLSARRG